MDNIKKYPDTARTYLPDGQPPALGSMFKQQDLGNTLSLMVRGEQQSLADGKSRESGIQAARDVFYKGDPAQRMVKALQDLGGLYTDDDFADYQSPDEEPISTTYRGYEIFTNRTWTQGVTLLQVLNILEGFDLATLGHNSSRTIHLQLEALKLAFADRERIYQTALQCGTTLVFANEDLIFSDPCSVEDIEQARQALVFSGEQAPR